MLTIPRSLQTQSDVHGYDDAAQARKTAMHKDGKAFLKKLALVLGLSPQQFDLRSNVAGIAVSGEVTLHADHLYVQLGSSFNGRGLQLLYRSCKSRKDSRGDTNHFVSMAELTDAERQERFVRTCKDLMERARAAAASSGASLRPAL